MDPSTQTLKAELLRQAENICQTYLSAGRRHGRYWLVGNLDNEPGDSLFVGLDRGKWKDGHTGQHGDLLDIIRHRANCPNFASAIEEAKRFLHITPSLPPLLPPRSSPDAPRRLFSISANIDGTPGETYLRRRSIATHPGPSIRFHPACYRKTEPHGVTEQHPAIVCAATDLAGSIHAVHRIYLDRSGNIAPFKKPKRTLGDMLGNAIRFGHARDVALAGEGVESVLSTRTILPTMPALATTSAAHLGALTIPNGLRRLYVAHDNDKAADLALDHLRKEATKTDLLVIPLFSQTGDHNDGLREDPFSFRETILRQLHPDDRDVFTCAPPGRSG